MTSSPEPHLTESLAENDEFEREPVPPGKVKGFKSFLGLVAGEHIAGTEFVIGPLFVLHGAGARDVFLGLLVGNILATLSWTLICAPIAVKTRLTIFFQLEKISGRSLVAFYNGVNALLFCVSAAAMIGVSASAIGTLLGLPTPGLTDLMPPGPVWVASVTVIGLVMAVVATYGFDRVSRFSTVFAPWMPLIFLTGAIAALPSLGALAGAEGAVVRDHRVDDLQRRTRVVGDSPAAAGVEVDPHPVEVPPATVVVDDLAADHGAGEHPPGSAVLAAEHGTALPAAVRPARSSR